MGTRPPVIPETIMIQELISTSAPRCLNGNAGFGIVAQTVGMAPNVSQAVNALSGYTHIAPPDSPRNPVVYLHAIRRTGGMARHIVSRVADCGNDYSGRSNRIAHHWIIEAPDTQSLPGGPAALILQNIYRSNWNEKPAELPPRQLSAPDVASNSCPTWERITGDAGWGRVVAERAAKGIPISIVFPPECNSENLQTLISEALALLPSPTRWKVTFSTYYMKSQEASGDKIQIKCFLAGSEASQFVRQSPNTLVIDLQERLGAAPAVQLSETPSSRNVGIVRGMVKQPSKGQQDLWENSVPSISTASISVPLKPSWINKNWQVCLASFIAFVLCVSLIITSVKLGNRNREIATLQPGAQAFLDLERLISLELPQVLEELDERESGEEREGSDLIRWIHGLCIDNIKMESEGKSSAADLEKSKTEVGKLKGELQKERERKAKLQNKVDEEQDRQDMIAKLKGLPNIWEGLAQRGNADTVVMQKSDFLNNLYEQGKASIKYVPFVEFNTPIKRGESQVILKFGEYTKYEMKDITETDDENSEAITTSVLHEERNNRYWSFLANEKEPIAEIRLTDKGMEFEWKPTERSGSDWERTRNLVLLAKLRITFEGCDYDVALWEPLRQSPSNSPWFSIGYPSENLVLECQVDPMSSVLTPDLTLFKKEFRDHSLQPRTASGPLQNFYESLYLVHPATKEKLLLLKR